MQLTKQVLESALEGEITDHLGYGKGGPAGKNGESSRNGVRAKTVLTDVGPVEIEVPRDRDGSSRPRVGTRSDVEMVPIGEAAWFTDLVAQARGG